MERDILVQPTNMTRPVKVDHLQSWSGIFRSDQTEMDHSIWLKPTETSWILGWMEIKRPWTPLSWGYWGLPLGYIKLIYPTTFRLCLLKFCHTVDQFNKWTSPKTVENKNPCGVQTWLTVNSSVFTYFQNILSGSRKYPHPHHGGNWKFGGDGEVRGPRNSRGEGGWMIKITFPRGQFQTQYENCYLLIW